MSEKWRAAFECWSKDQDCVFHSSVLHESNSFEDAIELALRGVRYHVADVTSLLAGMVADGAFESNPPRDFEVVFREAAAAYLKAVDDWVCKHAKDGEELE